MAGKTSLIAWVMVSALLYGCSAPVEEESSTETEKVDIYVQLSSAITFKEPENSRIEEPVKIQLNAKAPSDIKVTFQATPETAELDRDFEFRTNTLTIPKGARSAEFPLTLMGDLLDEYDETLVLTAVSATNAKILKTASATKITIRDTDADVVAALETDFGQAAEGSGLYRVKINLSAPVQKQLEMPFSVSGLASPGVDYTILTPSPIQIPLEADSFFIDFNILSDNVPEGGESIVIDLLKPDDFKLGKLNQMTVFVPGDVSLNDTGVVTWFDGISFDATSSQADFPGQDADYGEDPIDTVDFDGHRAFSFTKIDGDGNAVSSLSSNYRCVQDNRTKLFWEIKMRHATLPNMGGDTLKEYISQTTKKDEYSYAYDDAHATYRAANYSYLWLNEEASANGGSPGAKGLPFVNAQYPISNICSYPNKNMANYMPSIRHCNTTDFTNAVSSLALCGFKDWRLPTLEELRSIYNNGRQLSNAPDYFPNTQMGEYLSSSPYVDGTGSTWCLDFSNGRAKLCNKQSPNYVRLVRGGKQ